MTVPAPGIGGWAIASGDGERAALGFDPERVERFGLSETRLFGGDSFSITVVRDGRIAFEVQTFNVMPHVRFDLWSCTKSFTSLAYMLAFARGELAPDARAYDLIAEGAPLTDPRKAQVTIEQLLTMSAGFRGEGEAMGGTPTAAHEGMFEYALGHTRSRYGASAAELMADPGTAFNYSDPGFSHLALAFAAATGRELDEVVAEEVLAPIGIEAAWWARTGGGELIGPHTIPHTGLCLSSRELARVGLLLRHDGVWDGARILPGAELAAALAPSRCLPTYGRAIWLNTERGLFPAAPEDTIAFMGYRSNRLYVIPSLDLVIARTGTGPPERDEAAFLENVLATLAG